MAVLRGINILDLLPVTTGISSAVPDGILEQIAALNIVDHRSTISPGFYLHAGTLQSVADQFDLNTTNWVVSIPGVSTGLPFRVAITRAGTFPPNGGGIANAANFNQENIPAVWAIDIVVNPVILVIPGLNAATINDGDPMKTPSLQAVSGGPLQRRVTLQASCVLRITGGGPGGTQVQLMDAPDPLDPNAPSGATVRANMQPNTAMFGSSQYGMKLDTLVADLSRQFTPPDIEARGHDEAWTGISLKELTFFLPVKTPLVDNLTLGVKDLIIGSPFGMQGEVAADFSKDFPDSLNSYMTIEQSVADASTIKISGTNTVVNPPLFEYPVATTATAQTQKIRAKFEIDEAAIPGVADTKVVGVWWKIPGGIEGNAAETPWFDAPTDDILRYRLRIVDATIIGQPAAQPSLVTAVPTGQTELQEVTVIFPRLAGAPSGSPPIIDAKVNGGSPYSNVMHLRGPRSSLTKIVLETRSQAIKVKWAIGVGSAPVIEPSANTFNLNRLPSGNGPFTLFVTDNNGDPADTQGVRRIRIDVVGAGPLAIGHQESAASSSLGIVSLDGTAAPLQPTTVTDTFLAREYHTKGARSTAQKAATLDGAKIQTDVGTDAEVEVAIPTGEDSPIPIVQASRPQNRAVQILYRFGSDVPIVVKAEDENATPEPKGQNQNTHKAIAYPLALNVSGLNDRGGLPGSDIHEQLAWWVAELERQNPAGDRTFYIVGRTDDLWYGVNEGVNNSQNAGLAETRRLNAETVLKKVVTDPTKIKSRIETGSAIGWPSSANGAPERMHKVGRLALPDGSKITGANGSPVYREGWTEDGLDTPSTSQHARAKADSNRFGYRCAEIFAIDVGQTPAPPPPNLNGKASLVRILVPGQDGPITKTVVATPKGANTDYRIRLRARWDSSSTSGAADFIPTLAEALIRWKSTDSTLPSVGGTPSPAVTNTTPSGPNYWEVLLNWAYDASTGQTEATGSLSVPHGKMQIISDVWTSGFAFGPALASKLDDADITRNEYGEFACGLACIGAGLAIGAFINKNAVDGDHKGSVIFDKFALSYKWNGAPHVAATTEYTVDLRVNTGIDGVFTVKGNLKMAYKGVGILFDGNNTGGLADISLCMKDLSVTIVDPGTWTLGGPLGNLIRIAASRMGNGSDWMEFDLEFSIDLGVVKLEGAVIRMRFESDPAHSAVELRGLTASINVPKTLTGKGSVTIGDSGSFRAMLGIEVIPAKLGAYGSLAVDQDFVAIEVGIQLPVGIPLAGTGLGLFGFMGRFVANGTRNLTACTHEDPVERQLQWYALEPDRKYKRLSGQYAFGVGAVIGTLPDGGFSFNAEGALTIGFPDISVVFSIDAHLITQRKSQATSQRGKSAASMRILGMVVIEPDAVMLAVRTTYKIPKLLELKIPISAYFPLANANKAWYIRIGSDNGPGRKGDPISLILFPEVLDVKAWAFVMFEERQLHQLGGSHIPSWANIPALDFEGFSIGIGAGFDLFWRAGPFSLGISAFLIVGLGTKPLLCAGAAGVAGSLDLVVITIDVNGWLYFRIQEGKNPYAKGHFCASIDCWLFTIEGCVDIEIGSESVADAPKPASPIIGLDLVDHLAIVKGKAAANGTGDVPVVWPDTVGVLKFTHEIDDKANSSTGFVRKVTPSAVASPWSGSNQLKYAFRLTKIELQKLDGATWNTVNGPFESVWWLPTHRAAVIQAAPTGIPPSSEEGRELGLWTINPAPWANWLTEDSKDVPGNPANTIGKLCDPVAPASPTCALGKDRAWADNAFGSFKATPQVGSVFPSKFTVTASLDSNKTLTELIALGSVAGYNYVPAAVTALGGLVNHDGVHVSEGWRFPAFRKQGAFVCTVPMALAPSKALVEGELLLQICAEGRELLPPSKRICDAMPAKDGWIDTFTGASSAVYRGKLECVAVNNERAIHLYDVIKGNHKDGAVGEVSVNVDPDKDSVRLTAYDANDVVLGQIQTRDFGRQWLKLSIAGIVKIRVQPTLGLVPVSIFGICWGTQTAGNALLSIYDLIDIQVLSTPQVIATNEQGDTQVLNGELVEVAETNIKTIERTRARPCRVFAYKLPKQANGKTWAKVAVAPWFRGNIALVALCGVTFEAYKARQDDQKFRLSLIDWLVENTKFVADNQLVQATYLDAGSRYKINVTWQYQSWTATKPGDDPPAPSATWLAGSTDEFRFDTAAFGVTNPASLPLAKDITLDMDPAQGGPGFDERTFDPRGVARYLMRAYPMHEDPPHFLDDPIGFWFRVNHLKSLVAKYDSRELKVKVYHTRPAAGSLNTYAGHIDGTRHILDVTLDDPSSSKFDPTTPKWELTTDAWSVNALELSKVYEQLPCIKVNPGSGASKVTVAADLIPSSEYDLLLNTVKTGDASVKEVVVARSHFRTSRYHNPTQMLRALGFAATTSGETPNDFITTFDLRAKYAGLTEVVISDTALDEALKLAGMDPWPIPPAPRTTVIWKQSNDVGHPWQIAGILVEADEPVWRAGMKTGALNKPTPAPRLEVKTLALYKTYEFSYRAFGVWHVDTNRQQVGNALQESVRNTAGTRILFTPGSTILPTDLTSRLFELQMQFKENGADAATGVISIFSRPTIVVQEL